MAKRGMLSQLGVADEVTYGTFVPPTRFFEFRNESIQVDIARIASQGIRAGRFNTARTGAYASHKRGAGGALTLEVMTKGFGWWLKHMMGTVVTTGPVSTAYTHTGSVGSLIGDFFSMEIGRDDERFRYEGGKVMSWEMSCAVGELLTTTLTLDFEDEDASSSALTTASYPTAMVPLSFLEGSLTIGGTATHVRAATARGDNNLSNERYFLRNSGNKKEPMDQGRSYGGTLDAEFENKTAYNRFINGAEAALVLLFEGPTISGSEKFSLTVNAPLVRFDGTTPVVEGPDIITQPLPFTILDDSITIAYKTTDATP